MAAEPVVLDIKRATQYAEITEDPYAQDLLRQIEHRKTARDDEMSRFADNCDRWDNLYYPNVMLKRGGASHWADDESAKIDGRSHISLNSYPTYVDVPAALQAVEPIENIKPLGDDNDARVMAAEMERVYFAWKEDAKWERKVHQACIVKGLYGRTAAKVYWDEETQKPEVSIIDQPRNLWLGYSSTNYTKLDWGLYVYRITPETAMEQFGCEVEASGDRNEGIYPIVRRMQHDIADSQERTTRNWLHDYDFMVEVYDYWYRVPKDGAKVEVGKPVEFVTRNAIFVGNVMVKDEEHSEYLGRIPYVPLYNSYIPGVPDGRSEYYDIEQLIAEKDERLTDASQMLKRAIEGQYWQLVGPEAPDVVPKGLERLKPNKVHGPGPGNRLEAIEPWMPTFQLEEFLSRLDRELVDVSGLNDLLRGLAPSSVMSSSKAITALVANYEARISMKRMVLYEWREAVWMMATDIWMDKNSAISPAFQAVGPLETDNPSLTPRDELETATMAANNVNAKLWSQKRGMDRVGVDDPEGESTLIKEERTDASMFPSDVLTMVSLMSAMQQLQITQQQMQAAAAPAPPTADQAMAARMAEAGGAQGTPMMIGEEEQVAGTPGGPGGELPPATEGQNFLAQQAITPEGANPRLLLQQPLQPEQEG